MPSRARAFSPEFLRCRRDVDLPGVEARLAAYRRAAFSKHIHDAYCVGAVLSGATRMWRQGVSTPVAAGSVVCIEPGEPHACNPIPDGRLAYVMFFLDARALPLLVEEQDRVGFAASLHARNPTLVRRLVAFFRGLGQSGSRLEKASRLCEAFAPFFRTLEAPARSDPRTVRHIREYLRENMRQNVSLAELAAVADRSPTYVLRLFRREAGLPPHAYQNFLRVAAAKRLLADGLPAAQVAQEVGFADQSHLIRAFTPQVGATPRQYRLSLSR